MTTIMIAKLVGAGVGIGLLSEAVSNERKISKEKKDREIRIQEELKRIKLERMIATDIADIKRRYGMI
jgi:hypothetical protein